MSNQQGGYRPQRMNYKKRSPVKGIVSSVVALSVLAGGGAFAFNNLTNKVQTSDATQYIAEETRPTKPAKKYDTPVDGLDGPLNILLMGSDARMENGKVNAEGMRSDTTILAHISEDRKNVDLVSIPRDILVEIPSCTLPDGSETAPEVAKFNGAFALGGQTGDVGAAAACTIKTFEGMSDVYVDGYAVIDFAGFEQVVDDLGGVEFTVEEDLVDPDFENLRIPAGTHNFDGKTALQYARVRKAVGQDGSDISRIGRQQELLSAIINKAKGKITDLPALYNMVGSFAEMTTTSPELGEVKNISGLAWSLKNISDDRLNFHTVPFTETGDGASLYMDQSAYTMWANLVEDVPLVQPEPEITEPTDETSSTDPMTGMPVTTDPLVEEPLVLETVQ